MTDIVAEARSWVGTPFRPQQSVKGHGCDCKGFIAGVARELGREEAQHSNALAVDYDINRVPRHRLKHGLAEVLESVRDIQPGDVLLLRKGRVPVHLAIVTDRDTAVHANPAYGKVVETKLRILLQEWPLDSVWRFRPCR